MHQAKRKKVFVDGRAAILLQISPVQAVECVRYFSVNHKSNLLLFFTPPEETEHGTRPGGRGPGGVPGGVDSIEQGGAYRGGLSVYRGGSIPIAFFSLSVCVCLCGVF